MHLKSLKLTNFKNYEFGNFEFSPRLNIIAGLNGMGKTNLLDAVYYLCMGKSHFAGTDRNVVRQGESFFRLEGRFRVGGKQEKIVVKVVPGKQKTIERNGNPHPRLADHVGLLPVVFKAPDDTVLALEGSEERRRFMDNTLSQLDSGYLDHLITYNKVLQSRNALLKQMAEQHAYNPVLVQVYDEQLLEPAQYIFEKRRAFTEQFQPVFNEHYDIISGRSEQVQLHYKSQLNGNVYRRLLEETGEKDRILQRTSSGIHKDDLVFVMNDLPLKRFASQGQLKSFVLALKLTQFDLLKGGKGKLPILLLDDLFDKLDDKRVQQLIELLVKGDFGQVFISDTHPERGEEITKYFGGAYKKFIIVEGAVSSEQ